MAGQYQQLGNYRLLGEIAATPVARVYRAEGVLLHNVVVVKWLKVSLVGQEQIRFEAEARALRQLIDPRYGVAVQDFEVDEQGHPYLVMPLISYGSWRQVMSRQERQTPESLLPYVQGVVKALHYAHNQGVIHANLKPENVLLGRNDEVLLTDFGLTALLALRSQTSAYMSPELKQGRAIPASDQYALGIMIYEWLTGKLPTQGAGASLRQHAPALSPKIEEVVRTALDPNPEHRYKSLTAFAKAFENACQPSQSMAPVIQTRSAPDPALAGQKAQQPVMASTTAERPAVSKARQPAGQQAAAAGKRGSAAPKPFQLWEPYGPEPPPDNEAAVAWLAGMNKIGALPVPSIGGKKPPVWLLILLVALVLIVLVSGSLAAYGAASGYGPFHSLHGSRSVAATKPPAGQPTAAHTAAPTTAAATLKSVTGGPISVAPGQPQTGTASCPNDEQLVGGGYSINPTSALTADASYPVDLHTWKAILTNGTSQTVQLTVYAECLAFAPDLGIKLVSSQPTSVAAGSTLAVIANCSAGIALGGGFLTDPAVNGLVVSSQPITSQNGWSISTKAEKKVLSETAYALCATKHIANPTLPTQNVTLSPGSASQGAIQCKDSTKLLTSGGFRGASAADDGNLFFSGSAPGADAASWQVSIYNNDTAQHTAALTGVCVSITGS